MRITFNAPFILGFSILASFVLVLSYSVGGHLNILTLNGQFDFQSWQAYLGLLLYPLSHSGIDHLVSNFSVILLIGPILEKQLGWQKLLLISVVTTIAIGVVHVVFSDSGLIGASGLVFLYIVLVSLSNSNDKEIPLTFILVVILFLGQEVLASFNIDNISHLAHIGGGVMAILFKYVFRNV